MDLKTLLGTPIAHRGLHDDNVRVPENSLAAFKKAVDAGYIIELDIRQLKDGEIVVFHDKTLDRLTGEDGLISEKTSKEIKDFRLFNTDEKVPLLSDVLKIVKGKVPLLIEIKSKGSNVGRLETELLKLLKNYKGEFAIQAFNPFSLGWLAKHAPNILRGQLSCDFREDKEMTFYEKFFARNLIVNLVSKPDFISYDIRCLPYLPVTLLKGDRPLLAWVVKTDAQTKKAEELCDNYIFEGFQA